jgi:hypothetical protein
LRGIAGGDTASASPLLKSGRSADHAVPAHRNRDALIVARRLPLGEGKGLFFMAHLQDEQGRSLKDQIARAIT